MVEKNASKRWKFVSLSSSSSSLDVDFINKFFPDRFSKKRAGEDQREIVHLSLWSVSLVLRESSTDSLRSRSSLIDNQHEGEERRKCTSSPLRPPSSRRDREDSSLIDRCRESSKSSSVRHRRESSLPIDRDSSCSKCSDTARRMDFVSKANHLGWISWLILPIHWNRRREIRCRTLLLTPSSDLHDVLSTSGKRFTHRSAQTKNHVVVR